MHANALSRLVGLTFVLSSALSSALSVGCAADPAAPVGAQCTEAECKAVCDGFLHEVQRGGLARSFASATCQTVNVAAGGEGSGPSPACVCENAEGTGAIDLAGQGGCQRFGHAGNCLYDDGDFPGCNVDTDDGTCATECQRLADLTAADAETEVSAELVQSGCDEAMSACSCVVYVEAFDHCMVSGSGGAPTSCPAT